MDIRQVTQAHGICANACATSGAETLTMPAEKIDVRTVTWVCCACGKHNTDRMKVGDESCYLNSMQVYEDACVLVSGRVVEVKDGGLVNEPETRIVRP
jgi:uncharacterized UBP type Zn finger protein